MDFEFSGVGVGVNADERRHVRGWTLASFPVTFASEIQHHVT
jgi:hypothetical protein